MVLVYRASTHRSIEGSPWKRIDTTAGRSGLKTWAAALLIVLIRLGILAVLVWRIAKRIRDG
jgi:hypothetical protein